MAATFTRGYAEGLPILRDALDAVSHDVDTGEEVLGPRLAYTAALQLWDDDLNEKLSRRWARQVREVGALSELPRALFSRALALASPGELAGAVAVVEEAQTAIEATGSTYLPYIPLVVAALLGREAEASAAIGAIMRAAPQRGEGLGISASEWAAQAVLGNGLGHYPEALSAAQRATENPWELGFANWALVELVEAAARSGVTEAAADAHRRLAEMTLPSGTDWALGIEARSRW